MTIRFSRIALCAAVMLGGMLVGAGPALAQCSHLGGTVVCPSGLPEGSTSLSFTNGGTLWQLPNGTTQIVNSTTFATFVPPAVIMLTPSDPAPAASVPLPAPGFPAAGPSPTIIGGIVSIASSPLTIDLTPTTGQGHAALTAPTLDPGLFAPGSNMEFRLEWYGPGPDRTDITAHPIDLETGQPISDDPVVNAPPGSYFPPASPGGISVFVPQPVAAVDRAYLDDPGIGPTAIESIAEWGAIRFRSPAR